MSASGTVTVRFDVQGNEKLLQTLITTATGSEKLNTSMVKLQSTLGGIGVGNLGPLNNIATSVKNTEAAMGTATTKVATFKEKLAGIGTQLGQNATSFGVATASVWGIYNAYDSLEKVQIRAHASAVKVSTLETSLAALTERRRLAVEKGNLTGEQMAILNEKIANTTEKLSVAQERNADVTQDVQEAWAGFFSTVGPQAIAATGSIIQLGTVFKSTFSGGGGFINTFKTAITGLFPSLAAAKAESLLLGRNIGNLGSSVSGLSSPLAGAKTATSGLVTNMAGLGGAATAATGTFGKLKMALGDVGNFLTSSKGLLLGMAGALGIAATAAVSLFHILSEGAKATAFNEKIMAGTASMKDLQDQIQTLQSLKADPFVQLEKWFYGGAIGKMIKPETTAGMSEELIKGIQAQIDVKEVGKTIQGMFDSMQPVPLGMNIDFTQMSPKIQAGLQTQMQKIITIINNPTNWKAKLDPVTGKEMFSQADVQHFTINALEPLFAELQKSVASGQFDTYIQQATDGIQKKFFTAMMGGPKGGGAAALTGETGKFAQAALQKQFAPTGFEAGSATEAAAKKAAADRIARNKLLVAANAEYAKSVEATTKTLDDQASSSAQLNAEDVQMIKTFGGLNRATLTNSEVRAKLLDISYKQQKGHEAEELSILDLAAANDVYSSELANLAATEGDHVAQMNEILAASINYTSALDDQDRNQKLVSEGFRDGIIQAKGYFDNLVKGTEQEGVFRDALADGAKTLGIKSNLLAFSTTKMQELIKSTYDQTQAYTAEALAASKSTAFLKDKVIIQGQVTAGTIEGRMAANDWAASLDKSIASEKANHEQLLQITADMTGLSIPMSLTNDQLKEVMTNFKLTGDAAGSLANVMSSTLGPSFEHLKGLFDATSMKDFKNALKDLSISKDLKGDLKDMGKSLVDLAKNRKGAQDTFDVLLQFGDEIVKKHPKDWAKFVGDLADKLAKGAGKKGLTDDMKKFIDQVRTMSPDELQAHAESVQMFIDAFDPKSEGGKKITSGEWEKILTKFNEEAKLVGPSAQGSVPGVDSLNTSMGSLSKSVGGAAKSLGEFASAQLDVGKSSPLTNLFLSQQKPDFGGGKDKTTEITPPAPIVFPPPDMHNITDAIAKIEVDIGSMVDFAANLVLAFPPMDIGTIDEGIATAEQNLGSIIDFTSGLVVSFPAPNIEAINTGIATAEQNLGSIIDFVAGLVATFPPPNIVAVVNQTSAAKKAAATLVTDIKALKPAFPPVNIVAVANSTSSAKKAAATLEGAVASLNLKFPKIDISNIESSVNQAQSKINSLKGTTVTNHVKTVFDNAGGNILNDIKLMSAAAGKLFTTNGEQLFRVGDNPGGRETVAMIPHDKPGPIIEKLNQMFPNVYSTLHQRVRKPAMQSVSNGIGGGMRSSGPTTVNVTTEVYLFPGSDMFKKFVKSIMLEEMSRYAAV